MSQFSQLKEKLTQMAYSAGQLDKQRGEHHQALFDSSLFTCRSRLLSPCVEEVKKTYDAICREQQHGLLTTQRAEYLSERLLAQISAITRELSTSHFRKDEPKHKSYYRKPINVYYQDLAKHKDWERQLMEMVMDRQQSLDNATGFNQGQAQQALLTAEQRLKRCQEAIIKIEKQITFREQHQ
ncbi:prepilin peptidase [Vibrio sp. UCD-FRSSP16_10]|uniref:primosomal replication protein n=1 Tax=unclassified Vibrio TaxID=2614977 RepID=UPI0007FDD732|nr:MULTISPECIES: primosomal replication protein [unclassified Vibrio]OBT13946.1 prepilin peptidase [Vibrio sp. UCD-FRSSP16_30]OBT22827.1 prepilin peptidase [Vibrio sp. UCD-FRSSP16_10]